MNNPHKLYKFGTILTFAGVLVWVPYFVLLMIGESPSLLVFLPFHLLGVVGGARLRKNAKEQLGIPVKKRRGYMLVAYFLVIAGLLVWIPYFALKLSERPVEIAPFLTIHLVGVLGGIGLMGVGGAVQYLQKIRQE